LLRDRAGAVRKDLAADAPTLSTMVRVCRALDGMPLAIECPPPEVVTVTAHHPLRPNWACAGCGYPWPCASRRGQLLGEYADHPAALRSASPPRGPAIGARPDVAPRDVAPRSAPPAAPPPERHPAERGAACCG
jgi:hypothetical protein